jgi:hypothetical protein
MNRHMKVTNSNKKIFGGIIVLLLAGVVFGYYFSHREKKTATDPIKNKSSENDSATHVNRETTPVEMGAKPEIDPEDGSVNIVKEFVKLNAKNPATFEFLEWSEISIEGGYWKVRCKYRGISSFNAEVTTNAWFYIQNNKIVYTKIISKI